MKDLPRLLRLTANGAMMAPPSAANSALCVLIESAATEIENHRKSPALYEPDPSVESAVFDVTKAIAWDDPERAALRALLLTAVAEMRSAKPERAKAPAEPAEPDPALSPEHRQY